MRVDVLIPPTDEQITLEEAKMYCRVDSDITDEDALIETLIAVAREQVETETSRALAPQTVRATFDGFPCGRRLSLPRFPLIEVESVVYDDDSGTEQTLATTAYSVAEHGMPGAIYAETSWPTTTARPGSVRVTYRCGYDALVTGEGEGEGESEGGAIPKRAIQAMLYLINHWYENREAVAMGRGPVVLPLAVRSLVSPLKVYYRREP